MLPGRRVVAGCWLKALFCEGSDKPRRRIDRNAAMVRTACAGGGLTFVGAVSDRAQPGRVCDRSLQVESTDHLSRAAGWRRGRDLNPDRLAPMPHFECGAFNHSATSPEGAIEGLRPLWLGALIGEDGWPDKARETKIGTVFRRTLRRSRAGGADCGFWRGFERFGPEFSRFARRGGRGRRRESRLEGKAEGGGTARRGKHWRSRAAH